MITEQQIEATIVQIKAKKFELIEECKNIDFQLARYIGMIEILKEQKKEKEVIKETLI